ncbi:MAG: (2Fe-2S)-binding protein [Acidimicrobiia bacterium]
MEVRARSDEPLLPIELTVNAQRVSATVAHRASLADLLRDQLGLTGTHVGCEQGVCGSCTVLVNGTSTRACLFLAAQADRTDVVTIEGLGTPAQLSDVQQAIVDRHGIQCGFCTPGFVVTLTELYESGRLERMSDAELRRELDGNLCRCTGYVGLVDAARDLRANTTTSRETR